MGVVIIVDCAGSKQRTSGGPSNSRRPLRPFSMLRRPRTLRFLASIVVFFNWYFNFNLVKIRITEVKLEICGVLSRRFGL